MTNLTFKHDTLHVDTIIGSMRAHGRDELVHFAGAAHRDLTAWLVVEEWLENPDRTEAELRELALARRYPES